MRKGRGKALLVASFVLVIGVLAGMGPSHADAVCTRGIPSVCVVLEGLSPTEPGATTHGIVVSGPMAGGHVLLECSATDDDKLHVQSVAGPRGFTFQFGFDRQVCS